MKATFFIFFVSAILGTTAFAVPKDGPWDNQMSAKISTRDFFFSIPSCNQSIPAHETSAICGALDAGEYEAARVSFDDGSSASLVWKTYFSTHGHSGFIAQLVDYPRDKANSPKVLSTLGPVELESAPNLIGLIHSHNGDKLRVQAIYLDNDESAKGSLNKIRSYL